jgi:hypothetical protein
VTAPPQLTDGENAAPAGRPLAGSGGCRSMAGGRDHVSVRIRSPSQASTDCMVAGMPCLACVAATTWASLVLTTWLRLAA